MKRWLGPWAAILACVSLMGCASWPATGDAGATARTGAASAAAVSGPRPGLRIVADTSMEAMLRRSVDLARAVDSPDSQNVNELEWARLMATAPAQAQQALRTVGLFEAQVQVQVISQQPLQMEMHVTPGEPVKVGRLTLEVQGELADLADEGPGTAQMLRDGLGRAWPLQPGAVFRMDDWSTAKNSVLARLRAEGYASATWAGTGAQVDPATRTVRLFVVADSGPLYRAGPIEVEGSERHSADAIRALADLPEGTALTETRLLDYQERLTKTGLFDQASVGFDPDPAQAARAVIKVSVKEAPLYTTTLSIGYSSNSGPRVGAEHLMRRVGEHPLQWRSKLEWARDKQSGSTELSTHSDANFNRNLLGLKVQREEVEAERTSGQSIRLGRIHEHKTFEWLLFTEHERSQFCALDDSFPCLRSRSTSLNAHLTWRQLDSLLLPTRGYALQLQVGVGHGQDNYGEQGRFARLYGRAMGYWPLPGQFYSQARLELGGTRAPSLLVLPDSQLFWAGGDDSVRGYAYKGLGGETYHGVVTGSRLLGTASVEIARPVSADLPSVWWAGFLDAGRAADTVAELKPALGYGLGMRWRSPVGALRVDWAWGQEVHKGRLHLSLGVSF